MLNPYAVLGLAMKSDENHSGMVSVLQLQGISSDAS
jgi:hypothetical protein